MLSVLAVVVAAVVATIGVVVVRAIADDPVAAQDELGPVLLVPGYGANMVALDPLAEALRAQDRQVVTVRPPGNGTGDLRSQAEHLGDVARQTVERTKAGSVDVVGFSAGGVVARLWVRDGDGRQLARRVLTIGSPHHGTDAAATAAELSGNCSRACDQLVPDSDLLRELNAGDETPGGPLWISIASTADQTVTPTRTSGLDGALNLLVQDVCPDNAPIHGALPHDPVVLATLTTALGRGRPLAPTDVSC
ncbi:esterase/lipase family protein [Aeromicrobium sp.]|uniref:esterase/lipase family protein n=1 Tax=Aeromicrobium sp. TaxID=1871063 RepID=UPI003D6A52FD